MLLKPIVVFWDNKKYYRTKMIFGSICRACEMWHTLGCCEYCQEVNEMFPHKEFAYVLKKAKNI